MEKIKVRYSEVDASFKLNLISLSSLIEDATTEYLEEHHLNNEYLKPRYNIILVVLRNKLVIEKMPKLNDILDFKVHLVKVNLMSFILETKVILNDEEVVTSFTEICGINYLTRESISLEFLSLKEDSLLPKIRIYSRIPQIEKQNELTHKVYSSDIDYSHHLNNVSYVRYYLNALKSEYYLSLDIYEFEINFISEVIEDEEITTIYQEDDYQIVFNILKNDGSISSKAVIRYR